MAPIGWSIGLGFSSPLAGGWDPFEVSPEYFGWPSQRTAMRRPPRRPESHPTAPTCRVSFLSCVVPQCRCLGPHGIFQLGPVRSSSRQGGAFVHLGPFGGPCKSGVGVGQRIGWRRRRTANALPLLLFFVLSSTPPLGLGKRRVQPCPASDYQRVSKIH